MSRSAIGVRGGNRGPTAVAGVAARRTVRLTLAISVLTVPTRCVTAAGWRVERALDARVVVLLRVALLHAQDLHLHLNLPEVRLEATDGPLRSTKACFQAPVPRGVKGCPAALRLQLQILLLQSCLYAP